MGNTDNIDKILSSIGDSDKDIFEIPEGHFARFEAKLPARKPNRIIPIISFASIAAAIALVVIFNFGNTSTVNNDIDYFADVPQTAEDVYNSYISQLSEVQASLENTPEGEYWIDTFEQIASENVPLLSTLPEELPREEAYAIVSHHYSTLLSDIYDFQKIALGVDVRRK